MDAVQITIETVAAMGGELGELMQAMRAKGPEWVQGLIEMCRESEILQKIFASVGALFACLPPNLWAEGIGTGVGYIVPELLISVVLAVLAAISAGAGAAALAARLLGYGARLREALSQHGRLGRVLLAVYDGIGNLADNISALVRALWRNISESVDGAVDRTNRILRQSRARKPRPRISSSKIAEILDTPKGKRPDPSTYIRQADIDQHLQTSREQGVIRFTSKSQFEHHGTLGPPGGTYGLPRAEFDRVMSRTGGDLNRVEEALGLDTGTLTSGDTLVAYIPPEELNGLRMPSGNELGATANGCPAAILPVAYLKLLWTHRRAKSFIQ